MDRAKLVTLFPIMTVRNRRNYAVSIPCTGGDSVHVQPNAQIVISSINLLNIPDHNDIELVSPTIFELSKTGIVSIGEAPELADAPAPAPKGKKN